MPYIEDYEKVMVLISPEKSPNLYILGGEEIYLTSRIEKAILNNLLDEAEKDFNLSILYGADTSPGEILSHALRYPMMAKHQLVVVKDAGKMHSLDGMESVIERLPATTILAMNFEGKNLDRRKAWIKAAEKSEKSVVFNSPKLTPYKIRKPLEWLMKEAGVLLSEPGKELLLENSGTDLTRLYQELQKLSLTSYAKEGVVIPPTAVMEYIGLSREFTIFEFQKALASKDAAKALKIARAYAADPKNHPVQMILSMLFNFFSNLLIAFDAPSKREEDLAKFLGLNSAFQSKDYQYALHHFRRPKVMNIISLIRRCDARSKGLYTNDTDPAPILTDLVFYITS